MQIFKVNKKIEIVCEAKRTRNGFKHTATLHHNGNEQESVKICYINRTWERYEYESVLEKLAEWSTTLSDSEKKLLSKKIKSQFQNEDNSLKTIGIIAKLGDIFGTSQKEKNDWKTRMLKAGLENQGLIIPDDWDELDEATKQARLDGAIAQLA